MLDRAHQEARAAFNGLAADRKKTDAGLDEIAKLSLPQGPYQEEQGAVAAATSQASAQLAADPVGTKTLVEQLKVRSEGLAKRISRVVILAGDAQRLKTSLEAIKRQAATHRAQGLRLLEEGGNPDPAVAQAETAFAATMTQLKAGDPDAASRELDAAKAAAAEGQATIDKVQKARSACERELVARRERPSACAPRCRRPRNTRRSSSAILPGRRGRPSRATSNRRNRSWRPSIARPSRPPRRQHPVARST